MASVVEVIEIGEIVPVDKELELKDLHNEFPELKKKPKKDLLEFDVLPAHRMFKNGMDHKNYNLKKSHAVMAKNIHNRMVTQNKKGKRYLIVQKSDIKGPLKYMYKGKGYQVTSLDNNSNCFCKKDKNPRYKISWDMMFQLFNKMVDIGVDVLEIVDDLID